MPQQQIRRLRDLWLLTVINIAAALIMPAAMWLFANPTPHELWLQFKHGLVYSWCIGPMVAIALERVAPRVACRRPGLRILAYLATLVTLALAGSVAANLFFVAAGWITWAGFRQNLTGGAKIALAITLLVGTLVTAFEALFHRLQAANLELSARQLAEERARKLATEAQLSSLESRIHPHFLFNTLNSISSLIREDPARAERTVERLALLLRYSLDVNARSLARLEQELQIVRSYLEIEKTRFGDRLRYTIDVAPEMFDVEVPPLALQTLVENSIKHAVAPSRHGGEIRVFGRIEEGRMVLEVNDDGPGFDLRALKPGHGLENLQDRLSALFEGAARLEITRRDGLMQVAVTMPLRKAAA